MLSSTCVRIYPRLAVDRPRYRLLRRESAGFRLTGTRAGCATFRDVRAITAVDLAGVDAVIHLAAISNDPMGNAYEKVTEDINYQGTLAVARAAREAGVRHFVFASSCSVYGFAEDGARNEQSSVNPLTAYARSKVASETEPRPNWPDRISSSPACDSPPPAEQVRASVSTWY